MCLFPPLFNFFFRLPLNVLVCTPGVGVPKVGNDLSIQCAILCSLIECLCVKFRELSRNRQYENSKGFTRSSGDWYLEYENRNSDFVFHAL